MTAQARQLRALRGLCSRGDRKVNGRSMASFLSPNVVDLADSIAATHDDPGVRALARELAAEARRLDRRTRT